LFMCTSRNSISICRVQLVSEAVNNSRRRVFGAHDEHQSVVVETFEATKPTSRNVTGDPCSMLFSQQGRYSSGATPNGELTGCGDRDRALNTWFRRVHRRDSATPTAMSASQCSVRGQIRPEGPIWRTLRAHGLHSPALHLTKET